MYVIPNKNRIYQFTHKITAILDNFIIIAIIIFISKLSIHHDYKSIDFLILINTMQTNKFAMEMNYEN